MTLIPKEPFYLPVFSFYTHMQDKSGPTVCSPGPGRFPPIHRAVPSRFVSLFCFHNGFLYKQSMRKGECTYEKSRHHHGQR